MRKLAAVIAFLIAPAAFAQSLDVVIGNVMKEYGGTSAWQTVTSIRETGKVVPAMRKGDGATTRTWQKPDKLRVEIVYPTETEVRIIDGDHGTRNGKDATGSALDAMKLQETRMELPLLLVAKQASLHDLGVREGFRAIEIPISTTLTVTVDIDPKSWHIVRSTGKTGGLEFIVDYSDFLRVEGLLFAFVEAGTAQGTPTANTALESVTINRATTAIADGQVTLVNNKPPKAVASEPSQTQRPPSKPASAAASGMTNAEVIQLVAAGLSERVVTTSIRQARSKEFDLTPRGLIALKKAGVSDAEIVAMQEGDTPAESPDRSSAGPARSSSRKLSQANAENAIRTFVSAHGMALQGGGNGCSISVESIVGIDPLSQFSETEATTLVGFKCMRGGIPFQFVFQKDVDDRWFLTKIEGATSWTYYEVDAVAMIRHNQNLREPAQ